MEYKIKIISEDNSEILFGHREDGQDKNTIKKVDMIFDTIDENVYSKGAGMLLRVTIEGDLKNEGTNMDQLIDLFNWAKSEESEEQYRTLEIEIWNNKTRLRVYHFERMFIVDYEEVYDSGGGKSSQDDSKFILKLIQQENNFDRAKTYK